MENNNQADEKLNVFKYYIEKIKTKSIKEFVKFVLLNIPEYFWTLPASTTGKHHGENELLIDHIKACLYLAEKVCNEQFKNKWDDKTKDKLYASLLLHDGWRCGEENHEEKITQEYIDKYQLDQSILGKLKTTREHPEIGYNQIIKLADKFNNTVDEEMKIDKNDLNDIAIAVKYHYGPFTKNTAFNLTDPFNSIVVQTHNIDFMQTMIAQYYTKNKLS